MVPGPALVSPPETDHVTVAAPPDCVAVNCSTACPVLLLVVLQPVQLVSIDTVPGVTESEPPPPPPPPLPEAEPPQPEMRMKAGTADAASTRAGQRRRKPA